MGRRSQQNRAHQVQTVRQKSLQCKKQILCRMWIRKIHKNTPIRLANKNRQRRTTRQN